MNTIRAAILVALAVTRVTCIDFKVGSNDGRVLYNKTFEAGAAVLWVQSQKVTINVTDPEVISGVEITDNRINKDGGLKVLSDEGKQSVKIELSAPNALRGMNYTVIAYAAPRQGQHPIDNDAQHPLATDTQHPIVDDVQHPTNNGVQHPAVNDFQHPVNDFQHPVNDFQHPVNDFKHPVNTFQHPTVTTKDITTSVKPGQESVTIADKVSESTPTTPATDLDRKSRKSETDPVVRFVTENGINVQDTTEFTTTDSGLEVNSAVPVSQENLGQKQDFFTNIPKDFEVKGLSTTTESHDQKKDFFTNVPHDSEFKGFSTTDIPATSTTEAPSTFAPVKTHEKMTMQNFDSISRELGQKVVFGIRKH